MNKSTIRFYAQINILNNYSKFVFDIINKYQEHLIILPNVKLESRFNFKGVNEQNDISIVIMRELETTREPQIQWFLRMTKDIADNTKQYLLLIVFSDMSDKKLFDQRKMLYEKQISNSTIYYFDLEDWFPDNPSDCDQLELCVDFYISSIIKNDY